MSPSEPRTLMETGDVITHILSCPMFGAVFRGLCGLPWGDRGDQRDVRVKSCKNEKVRQRSRSKHREGPFHWSVSLSRQRRFGKGGCTVLDLWGVPSATLDA